MGLATGAGPGTVVPRAGGFRAAFGLLGEGARVGRTINPEEFPMATVTSSLPPATQQPKVPAPAQARAVPASHPAVEPFPPTWEHTGHRGDYIALVFLVCSFLILAFMNLIDLALGIFR
jgi:hypothetical protein